MKYAHIEENTNRLLGWYDSDIHADIPKGSIEVSDAVWEQAIAINANALDMDAFVVKDLRTEDERREGTILMVESLFEKFAVQIKGIAINKTGTSAYINAQAEVYEAMFDNAINGYYNQAVNESIIQANRAGKALVAELVLAMNELRSLLVSSVQSGIDVTDKIAKLESLTLTRESCTKEAIGRFMEGF